LNKKQLQNMQNAVVRLSPGPVLIDRQKRGRRLDNVLWRVTGYVREGQKQQIIVETMSQALGLRLALYFDSVREFQDEDLHHPTFKQGILLLKSLWVIPPEGAPAWRIPLT
jgi:hypothetical protein